MKKLLTVILLFYSCLYSQSIGLGNTDPAVFTKYRIPKTVVHAPRASLDFDFSSFNSGNTENSVNFSIYPSYYYLEQDDFYSLSNLMRSSFFISNRKNEYSDHKSSSDNTGFNFYNDFSMRNYFDQNTFLNANMLTRISYSLRKQINDNNTLNMPNNSLNKWLYQDYGAYLGIGWGKIRDITPVISAIRLQERLKTIGHINTDLNEKDLVSLAQSLSRVNHYNLTAFRGGKNFWKDFESEPVYEKLKFKDMTPFELNYAMESLLESKLQRMEGFLCSANIGLHYDNQRSENHYPMKDVFLEENMAVNLMVSLEYSHQLSLDQQLHILFQGISSKLVDSNPVTKKLNNRLLLNIDYGYEINDRFIFTVKTETDWGRREAYTYSELRQSFSVGGSFFFADNISGDMNYMFYYNDENNIIRRNHFVTMGLTYYLNGWVKF